MTNFNRVRFAARAAMFHALFSLVVASTAALVVFGFWYPFPYRDLSGGRELFLLLLWVDVVCGPILTLVIFNPAKFRHELARDLSFVVLIQFVALIYGITTVWMARPLYLVLEIDRFRVIAATDLEADSAARLPKNMRPHLFSGPLVMGIRPPLDNEEQQKVLFESLRGGRDYAERPEFYLPYEGIVATNSLKRARPISVFLEKYPLEKDTVALLAREHSVDVNQWFYLPVRGREDWVAILNTDGAIQGFLKGDGF
jgi:hypothetical protein